MENIIATKSVFRICNENGNKYTGFSLSKVSNVLKLFREGVFIGRKFNLGVYSYEVVNIFIDNIYEGLTDYITLDEESIKVGTHIWICCKTDDPRIKEGSLTDDNLMGLLDDINSINLY